MSDVPEGYKMSEVGVIPEEWVVKTLGEIANFYSGGTPSTSNSAYYGGEIAWITSSDLNKKIIFSVEGRITQQGLKNSSAKMVDENTLLIALYGATAAVTAITKIKAAINQAVLAIIPQEHDTQYLYYKISSLKTWIINTYTQGGQPNLSGNIVKSIALSIPPLPEQQAIASALSDVDALITALEQLITKKRNIKQGAMQQLLTGKKRLSGFGGAWDVKKLGEIAEIKTGKKNNEDKVTEGKYLFFVRSQQVERIDTYSFDGEAILMPGEGNIGSIIHYINGKFDYHQRVYKISNISKDCYGKYIYYCIVQNFNQHAMKNSVKATVDSLRLPTFQEFEFNSPSLPEQQAIAKILSDMDTEIEALEQKRDKYKVIKQGMMQELLSGKTRLAKEDKT